MCYYLNNIFLKKLKKKPFKMTVLTNANWVVHD